MYPLLTGSLTIERLQVTIAGLPAHLRGLRLVQMSDFHYDGIRLSERLLQDAIAATNAEEPDLIVLTGDFVTDDPQPIHGLARHLKALQSQYGVYAVLGNHDIRYPRSRAEITTALTNSGIDVLWNQVTYPVGPALPLVGLADFWSSEFRPATVLSHVDPTVPRLVLSHNPDTAELLQSWRVDLQLSGHTHGGQVVLPGIGTVPAYLTRLYSQMPKSIRHRIPLLRTCYRTARHWEWAQGFHQVGNNQLYVNRGLGTYLPGRFRCTPEVSVITLV